MVKMNSYQMSNGTLDSRKQKIFSSHLGIEPRTFGLEVQRAILCANGTPHRSLLVKPGMKEHMYIMAPQLSWLERRANNAKVMGSIPLGAKKYFAARAGARTLDRQVKSLTLYRLSYPGFLPDYRDGLSLEKNDTSIEARPALNTVPSVWQNVLPQSTFVKIFLAKTPSSRI